MTRPAPTVTVSVEELAQEIRRVDGNHDLGAGALAEALVPFLSSMLAAAPAAPQAAGVGELVSDLNVLATCDDMEVSHSGGDTNVGDVARRCLNHLRAPSREPEGGAVSRDQVLAIVRQFASPSWCSVDRLVDTLFTALATRETLNAAEKGRLAAVIQMLEPVAENNETVRLYGKEVSVLLKALRAQPEAREDAQPVTCERCYRGEVFGLSMDDGFWVEFSSAAGGAHPAGMNGWLELAEHHPDGRVVMREYVAKDSPIYPAPDALRVAVEALEKIKAVRVCKESANIWTGADACRKIATEALAALQAEQGAK